MGNVFSKRISLRESIFTLDEKIQKTENYIVKLENLKGYISLRIYLLSSLLIPAFFLYTYFFEENYYLPSLFIVIFFLFKLFIDFIFNKRIYYNSKLLLSLKETQKEKIELLKKEAMYTETKKIVEKYEKKEKIVEKKVNVTPVKDISKTKRGMVDKVADLILGTDPSSMYALICEKCFSHNGLAHPLEYNLTKFYCFNCNHFNDKSIVQKTNAVMEMEENKEKDVKK